LLVACASNSGESDDSTEAIQADLHHCPTPTKASLGEIIFQDRNMSEPAGQACASCHDPAHGYADPRRTYTSQGAIRGRFGVRNAPTITYASFSPKLTRAGDEGGYSGGQFWDGRVSTLEDQAKGPLLNPLEMNNPDTATIQKKLQHAWYAADFRKVFGADALDDADTALQHLAEAVAEFERTGIKNRFTSKYDAFLAGKATLSAAERNGLSLFEDARTGPCTVGGGPPCGCANCHLDQPSADGSAPLFTDFGYDNIGIPKNTKNPFYSLPASLNPGGASFVDNGLGWVHNPRQFGHFKAPTLRNVALTAPYGHNGYFPDLKSIVHFYNTRDLPGAWDAPEQPFGMNATGLGKLGLTSSEEDDLVAFLHTLTDGYMVH
jgi:cytochrome c peroxidase